MGYRIGVDVGGTFTDICLFDEESLKTIIHKLPSTNKDPSAAIIKGISEIIQTNNLPMQKITSLVHGTTVGTNAAIQRRGAKTALLTTEGFRDLLEIGRQVRPSLYNLQADKPEQLVKRKWRKEIKERILYDGGIYQDIDLQEAESIIDDLINEGVEAISVCFLHSYVNAKHEKEIKALLKEKYPNVYISLSSEVLPEYREYERLSTTILNSYIGPVISDYMNNLEKELKGIGVQVRPYISHSSGGLMSVSTTKSNPVKTALSGPSAGVSGVVHVAKLAGFNNLITLDMGGTSADVSLIQDLKVKVATGKKVAGFPLNIPMTDIHAVGAGGGSIAWIDSGGMLKVGPQSAGADPGPVSYGGSGTEPTVTDANVLLKRLNPEWLLGGKMKVNYDGAEVAVNEKLAQHLHLDTTDVAYGIIKVTNSNLVRAIRVVSVEQGHDPRDFTLVAYGGAGPLHAAEVAKELGMKYVLIPESPGILCAMGLLATDLKMDYVQTKIITANPTNLCTIKSEITELEKKAMNWFVEENISSEKQGIERSFSMRYKGQNYELTVDADFNINEEQDLNKLIEKFHDTHKKIYGYANNDEDVQIVNFRITASGQIDKVVLKKYDEHIDSNQAIIDSREVYFDEEKDFVKTNIYKRELMGVNDSISGPAIIEQVDTTIVVPPNVTAKMDSYRNIILELGG